MGCIYKDDLGLVVDDNMARGTLRHLAKPAKQGFPHVGRPLVLGFHLIAIRPCPLGYCSYMAQVY